MTELDTVTGVIVDASVQIHRDLGPGLLESVYDAVLARALTRRGLHVERHASVSFEFDGMRFDEGLRVDLLVEQRVVVELKSVEQLAPVHFKQLLTYLKLLKLPVGLLINFGAPTLKEGLRRVVNNYPDGARGAKAESSRAETLGTQRQAGISRGGAEGAETGGYLTRRRGGRGDDLIG